MPTTPAGTEYEVIEGAPSGAVRSWIGYPTALAGQPMPLIVYCHGSNGASNQFATLAAWDGLRHWLIDNGWAWTEGHGQAQGWGNQAQRDGYQAAAGWAREELAVTDIVVLGRSMGGLISHWLYLYGDNIADIARGLIVNSGTTDLAYRYEHGNQQSRQWIRDAYNATTDEEFAQNSVGHDPMLFPVEDWTGKRVMHMYGTADATVPAEHHALAWWDKYTHVLDYGVLDVRQGGDHSGGNGSYQQVSQMTSFLQHVTTPPGPDPDPNWPLPPPGAVWRARPARARLYLDGALTPIHAITQR